MFAVAAINTCLLSLLIRSDCIDWQICESKAKTFVWQLTTTTTLTVNCKLDFDEWLIDGDRSILIWNAFCLQINDFISRIEPKHKFTVSRMLICPFPLETPHSICDICFHYHLGTYLLENCHGGLAVIHPNVSWPCEYVNVQELWMKLRKELMVSIMHRLHYWCLYCK